MLARTLSLFREAVSGAVALRDLAGITAYHRIQSSPGFREAAQFCRDRLRRAGLPAEVLSFHADGVNAYWGHPLPQEWVAHAASLRLVAPQEKARLLADYRDEKISLIQRSLATPADGIEADVIVLEDGEEEAEYEGLDVRGKLVLSRGSVDRVRQLAVTRFGASGILYDGMRETPPVRPTLGLPEARQYTSFWWEQTGEDTPARCFGFVLSPQQGEQLRRLVHSEAREGRAVRVHAEVDASFYAGHMEIVEAFLPGETDEEVWLVAHLCHPQPSANDNASGAAALIEVARALAGLLEEGRLARPRRGIRFLLVPEMSGTFAYAATHEEVLPRVVAALNLDMVGEDQTQCGSTLNVTGAPLAVPSVCDDLLALILEEVAREGKGFMGAAEYALFRWTESPFAGGSDHYILTDPTVGIPCPMLIQWPDKFYHTTADTLDKVDPDMLARVGVAAAAYLWWFATAGPREALWLGRAMVSRTGARMGAMGQSWSDGLLNREEAPASTELGTALHEFRRRLDLLLEQRLDSFGLLEQLAGEELAPRARWEEQVQAAARRESARAEDALRGLFDLEEIPGPPEPVSGEWEDRAASLVPRRTLRGPFATRARQARLSPEDREAYRTLMKQQREGRLPVLAMYWTDGRRTLLEVADRVGLEAGKREVEWLVRYFELLEKMGLVEMQRGQE